MSGADPLISWLLCYYRIARLCNLRVWRNGRRAWFRSMWGQPCESSNLSDATKKYAGMVELVVTLALEASARKGVRVRVSLPVPNNDLWGNGRPEKLKPFCGEIRVLVRIQLLQ